MAQYLISVLNDTDDLATDAEMAAIDIFNEQLQAAAPGTASSLPRATP